MSRIVLSLLVDNTAGVLSRVAGLFSRRGYNIESLTVGVTADPRYSRMTVVSLGDHQVLEQIQKQLGKLEDVHDCSTRASLFSMFFVISSLLFSLSIFFLIESIESSQPSAFSSL